MSPIRRQAYLAASPARELAVVKHYNPPNAQAPILNLPPEVVFRICKLATNADGDSTQICYTVRGCRYSGVIALLCTCRLMRSLCLPLLYQDIHFHYPAHMIPPTQPVKWLHRSLQYDRDLAGHCRTLVVKGKDNTSKLRADDSAIVTDLMCWLTSVRHLHFYGGFQGSQSHDLWGLIRAAGEHMKRVESLSLSRQYWGLKLQQILDNVEIPSLKSLTLHGISESPESPVTLDAKRQRTASFTKLAISDYEETPDATAQLLLWPKHLTHFRFDSYYNNRHFVDLPMFRSMLLPHRDTLQSIDIGSLPRSGRGLPLEVTDFSCLEKLKLSRWQMDENLALSFQYASMLLAPKLQTFEWDFNIMDQHSEAWTAFGEKEESWLRELLRIVVSRKAVLNTVKIRFTPDYYGVPKDAGYPWDRLDRLKKEFEAYSITVSYSHPPISKEKWLAQFEDTAGSVTSGQGE